uniref:ATP-binding protein n=1 Tax=Paractinoplanes polyasparticus TaxID=2856853 RepID=UPI001C864BF6|nr:ATP-binding protein [Actinoplanes polyasparticus]
MANLGQQLADLRRRSFVGRDQELTLFKDALNQPGVIFVHGQGGIGKSALLDAYADIAVAAGRAPVRVDARALDPGRNGPASGPWLIDAYDQLAFADDVIRGQFLPALPADTLTVIAGRQPPGPGWLSDLAWRGLLHVLPLGPLTPADCRAYLAGQQVTDDRHERLAALSHGHPLTLALLADAVRRGAEPRTLSDLPAVVGAVLDRVVEAPSPQHRAALEICAHAPVTTEDLLRSVLGDGATELFAWLRSQPFIYQGPYGLYPYDIVRDLVDADLRWRDPSGHADLRRRLNAAMVTRIRSTADEREQLQLVADAITIGSARDRAAVCPPRAGATRASVDRLRDGDRDTLVNMSATVDGPAQAELVKFWLDAQPGGFRVFRDPAGEPCGFTACLDLTEADLGVDPGTDAMWRHAQDNAPCRSGEHIRAWRFFVDRDHGQAVSPLLTLFTACQVLDIVTRDDTAWTLVGACADHQEWVAGLAGLGFQPATGFTVGGTWFPVYAHDWRRITPAEWLSSSAADRAYPKESAGLLSKPEFAAAVRSALRNLNDPGLLRASPLIRSGVIQPATAEALREQIERAAEILPSAPRELITRTFLRPVTSQERVAESMHLSFNTYRRHRDKAVAHIADRLWELGFAPRPGTDI